MHSDAIKLLDYIIKVNEKKEATPELEKTILTLYFIKNTIFRDKRKKAGKKEIDF